MKKILIIEESKSVRYALTNVLRGAGFMATAVEDGYRGISEITSSGYDLVICDMKFPGMNGAHSLGEIRNIRTDLPVLVLDASGNIKNAVEAMKNGAIDYLTKPFNNNDLILAIRKALELRYLKRELVKLPEQKDDTGNSGIVIGNSSKMRDIYEQVKIVAPTGLTVLIQGETGTGKEVIANMIYRLSDRKNKPFIAIDCGAIPEPLIESELFGYEKGAFTDARNQKEGKFEQAEGGTIFLDEITNLTDSNQIKLLRVLQERKITRLGGKKLIYLNVRIITATNFKLMSSVNSKIFREDLFYRLNEFNLNIPPLRERKEDIILFTEHFIKAANAEMNKNVKSIAPGVLKKIENHSWPGNIRELRNVIRRGVLLSSGNILNSICIQEIPDVKSNIIQYPKQNQIY